MPSFRAQLNITGLRPGHLPEQVMEAAVDGVGSAHVVEANQLDVVAGVPRITVRFTVDPNSYDAEDRQALQTAANMRHAVEQVATTERLAVLRRSRGKWLTLR